MNPIIERIKNILMLPTKEWDKIKEERWTNQDLLVKYAMILAAIPAVAGFIGHALIGQSSWGITVRMPVGRALIWMLLTYGFSVGGVYVVALVMDALAPSFGSQKDLNTSLKAVVFSNTAVWIGGIFNILPSLAFLGGVVAIYSLVLLYFGMKALKAPPEDKLLVYYIITIAVTILIYIIISFVLGSILMVGIDRPEVPVLFPT